MESSVHEAKLLAPMIDDSMQVTEAQMERWAEEIDSPGHLRRILQ